VQQLIDSGLLWLHAVKKTGSVYSVMGDKSPKKIFLFLYDALDSGYSESKKMILSYLKFRQGENAQAWPHLVTICGDLGMSRATVCRLLKELEQAGAIAVQHANGGIGQGNRYSVILRDTKSDSRVSKCDTYNKHYKEFKELHNPEELSGQEIIKKRSLLAQHGVAHPVAIALTTQHSLANVEAAVINAVCQEQLKGQQRRKFNRAAYIVGILNKSREQGRNVELNLFAQAAKKNHALQSARINDLRSVKAIDQGKILAELQQRNSELAAGTARRNVSDSIRRILGVA
jgi:hypothetical protein